MSVTRRARRGVTLALLFLPFCGCTTIDPGPNFVVPDETFDANFFYCHVEPELIIALKCGPGDPSKGDPPNSCHFSSAVSGMVLLDHPAVNCGGGDIALDATQIGTGTAAETDYEAVSFEMSRVYTDAPLYVRPTGTSHPRVIFDPSDTAINTLLAEWAAK